ncbi:hypothetical protein VaNZ11_003603 [Volvox africanus]|uniref:SGNH hydrolase-type esterase domain-containing protein n=1 Tax=Volvox africanus TaxID=51714 RepID=A0ABQ5RVE7_9CHLO|nr:hypothetical protein VaNZ11_003603 [Volvox africanus]
MGPIKDFLFILLAIAKLPLSICYQHATSPRIENLTDVEIKYANIYWYYDPAARVVHANKTYHRSGRSSASGPHISLEYRFVVPLPERLAGLAYVGHAARLRLVLERARNGQPLIVGALGGSITFGQSVGGWKGSYVKIFTDWLNAAMPPPHRQPRRRAAEEGNATAAEASAQSGSAATNALAGAPLAAAQRTLKGLSAIASVGMADVERGDTAAVKDLAAAGAIRGQAAGAEQGRVTALTSRKMLAGIAAATTGAMLDTPDATGGAKPPTEATAPQRDGGTGSYRDGHAGSWRGQPLRHDFLNGAVPGTQSAYMSSCLRYHLPPAVDIVFVEYAANDSPAPRWTFADPCRRSLERLLRKLLNLPSQPAVVLVNMYAIGAARGKYLHTAERDFMEFATYYSLPAVSLKAAVLPSAAVAGAAAVSLGAIFNGGHNHPGRGGHVVITELLITLCLSLLRSSTDSEGSDTWVAPVIDDAGAAPAVTAAAATDALAALEAVASRPLPPPLANGNYESSESTCYIEHDLQGLILAPLEGWEWTDEGRGKWGYVAMAPGKTLRLKVNTRLVGNRSADHAAASIIVQIAYLQSYIGMGTARLVCMEGCRCRPLTIDAYDKRDVSVTSMADLKVTQHPDCVLALTTKGPSQQAVIAAAGNWKNTTASGGGGDDGGSPAEGLSASREGESGAAWNKFKLMGVVVGEEPGAEEGGVTWMRDESHETAHAMQVTGKGSSATTHTHKR